MESGGENHSASGKSGGGANGGLSWDIWELGGPWGGALHHAPHHHHHPPAFFHPGQTPATLPTISSSPSPSPSSLSPSFFSFHHAGTPSADAHHLTCLKLGKRQYCEERHAPDPAAGGMKRERVQATVAPTGAPSSAAATASSSSSSSATVAVVPRCQVEGCNVALVDAKDYHRRHKVCEMHSKAPKVVVLGIEQRFCQQCSRFHVISEFDESKRSCRRRLAGHNERRRKSSAESIIRNPPHLDNTVLGGGFPYIPTSNTPSRALSLLSPKASSWVSPDLSSQSSAALRELIAENRAAVLARQLFSDHGWHNTSPGAQASLSYMPQQHPLPLDASSQLTDGWEHLRGPSAHVTLDLMQMPGSSFEILSGRSRSKDDDEECCEIWKSLEGTHVV